MRFVEPIVRPRPLLWAAWIVGILLSLLAVNDPTMPLSRFAMPFVLPAALVFLGMFVHGICLIFLCTGTAGPLGCPELLPTEREARFWTVRTEWSRRNASLGTSPTGMLVTMAWFPPEPISWRDQLALTKLILWRPLPAILIAPALIGCMCFLAAWEGTFGMSAPTKDMSN